MKLVMHDLCKNYGDNQALKPLNLVLDHGIYALLGPNGAGKSTLMNILALLIEPSDGVVTCNGRDIHNNRKYLKKVGYMPQKQCLYDDFTLEEQLYYLGRLKGMKKKDIVLRTKMLAKEVQLEDELQDKIGSFSGGMKQRAMLAGAMLDDPELLILDEPTAGLDPMKRMEMQNMIAGLAKDKIVLIATHVVSDVEFIANQFIFLKKGKIVLQGSRTEVLQPLQHHIKTLPITQDAYHSDVCRSMISSVFYEGDRLMARLVDEKGIYPGREVPPVISDVYFCLFRGEHALVRHQEDNSE